MFQPEVSVSIDSKSHIDHADERRVALGDKQHTKSPAVAPALPWVFPTPTFSALAILFLVAVVSVVAFASSTPDTAERPIAYQCNPL